LRHVLAGLAAQFFFQRLAFGGLEHAHDDRLAVLTEAGPHDHGVEVGHHEGVGRRLAQPPYVERRQFEFRAEQLLRQPFEERHQRRRLDQARAQRVGERDLVGARGLDQAGHAER
jgi:hypothetical protein